MKAELRPRPHKLYPGVTVYEVYFGGRLIGEVTGADGPGIRFVTHHVPKLSGDIVAGLHITDLVVQVY